MSGSEDSGGKPPDEGGVPPHEETAQFPMPLHVPTSVADGADGEVDDERVLTIVDRPPEPEPPPFAVQHSGAAEPPPPPGRLVTRIQELEHRMRAFEDAHTTRAKADSEANARLSTLRNALLGDLRAGDERVTGQLRNFAEEINGTIAGLQTALDGLRMVLVQKVGREGVELLSTDVGKIGRKVVTLAKDVEGLRAVGQEHETAHAALGERIIDLVGTLNALQARTNMLRRANDEVGEGLRGLRASMQDAGTRMDTLSSEIQGSARVTQEVAGRVDGIEHGTQVVRAEVAALRDASVASEARTGSRLAELEALVVSLRTDLASRASVEDVRRVEDGLRDARARLEATGSSLETLHAEGVRRDRTLTRIEERLGGFDSRMNGLDHTARSLATVDASLRTDLGALGGEVSTLQSAVEALDLRFDTAVQPVENMLAQAGRLSEGFEAIRVRMDALASTMSGVSGASEAQEKRVGDVESRMAALDELAGLKALAQELRKKLVSLEGWRRVFAREAEAYAKRLGIAPPPWVAADKERPS